MFYNSLFYNAEFPEKSQWEHLRSVQLTQAARGIIAALEADLRTDQRHLVPGLRKGLEAIAQVALI